MTVSDLIPPSASRALGSIAEDLHRQFEGVFSEETIRQLLEDGYLSLAATARVNRWLVLSTERFARQRLEAQVHSQLPIYGRRPSVLFLCVHNAGRSQMALGFFHHLAEGKGIAWSGGSEPVARINPAAVAAMAEVGIDIAKEFPKPWTDEFLTAADVVITMGCGDACPLVDGKHYEDWELDDPSGKTLDQVRPIRDQIGQQVEMLLERFGILTSTSRN